MGKLLSLLGLLSSLSLLEASVVSFKSPWGACVRPVCWNPTGAPEGWRLEHYNAGLDSAVSLGISWVRLTGHGLLQGDDLSFNFRYEPFLQKLSAHNLNMLAQTWPNSNTSAGVTRDTATWGTAKMNWANFWDIVVKRYKDGVDDGQGGKTKPINHWKICCEPSGYIGTPWAIPIIKLSEYETVEFGISNYSMEKLATYCNSHPDTLTAAVWLWPTATTGDSSLKHLEFWSTVYEDIRMFLYEYIKTSAEAIHNADPDAKVMAPSFAYMPGDWYVRIQAKDSLNVERIWTVNLIFPQEEDSVYTNPSTGFTYVVPRQVKDFWQNCVANASIKQKIDIFDVHGYNRKKDEKLNYDVDKWLSIKQEWDRLCGGPSGGPNSKPFWITEVGWEVDRAAKDISKASYDGDDSHWQDPVIYKQAEDSVAVGYTNLLNKWYNYKISGSFGPEDKIFFYQLYNQSADPPDDLEEDRAGLLFRNLGHISDLAGGPAYPELRDANSPSYDIVRKFIHSHWDLFVDNVPGEEWFKSPISSATAYNNGRRLLVDGDSNLHCVFTSWHNEIMYAMSSDGGATWKHKWVVGEGKEPAMAISNDGKVCVVWTDEKKVFYKYMSSGTWSSLYASATYDEVEAPSIAVKGDNAHLVWTAKSGSNYNIFYKTFAITDPNLKNPETVFGPFLRYVSPPSIDISDNGFPHVCWTRQDGISPIFYELWCANRDNMGNWNKNTIFWCVERWRGASIGIHGGYSHVVFEALGDIWYKSAKIDISSGNEVLEWGEPINISNSPDENSEQPIIVAGSQILWREQVRDPAVAYRIYYSHFDEGKWSTPEEIAQPVEPTTEEYFPQACVKMTGPTTGNLHFVYTEGNGSPYKIKYSSKENIYIPSLYISVTSPTEFDNQCNKWRIGYTMPIIWQVSDVSGVASQEIWLADVDGGDRQIIKNVGPGVVGPYFWTVKVPNAGDYKIKIKILDGDENLLGVGLSKVFTATNELVLNPEFEDELCCWTSYPEPHVYSVSSPGHNNSEYCACINKTVTGKWSGLEQLNIPCEPNTDYMLSWWAKVNRTSTEGNGVVGFGVWNNNHNDYYMEPSVPEWTYFSNHWNSGEAGNLQIVLCGSPAFEGNIWIDDIQLMKPMVSSEKEITAYNNQRKLVVDRNRDLHLVWTNYGKVWYAKSTNDGNTWTNKCIVAEGNYPAIAVDNNDVVNICWVVKEWATPVLYYSTDLGKTSQELCRMWSSGGAIMGTNFAPPAMVIDRNNQVHVGLKAIRSVEGGYEYTIQYRTFPVGNPLAQPDWEPVAFYSTVGGIGIEPFTSVSIDVDNARQPHIAYEFPTETYSSEVYYTNKLSGDWNSYKVYPGQQNTNPCIDVHNNQVYIVWQDDGDVWERDFPVNDPPDFSGQAQIISRVFEHSEMFQEARYPIIVEGSQILFQMLVYRDYYDHSKGADWRIYYSGFNGTMWGGDVGNPLPKEVTSSGASFYPQACVKFYGPQYPPSTKLHFVYTYNSGVGEPYEIKHSSKDIPFHWWEPREVDRDMKWCGIIGLTGDVTILPGVTLTIEPGATLYFTNGDAQNSGNDPTKSELIVQGKLIAQGTETDSIKFTSASDNPTGGNWYGIVFSGSDANSSIIDHCVVEYGTRGISCESASPLIQNSLIRENYNPDEPYYYYSGGIWCNYSQATISGNTIIDNAPLPPPPPPGQELTQNLPAFSGYRQSIDISTRLKTGRPVSPIRSPLSLKLRQNNVNRITPVANALSLDKQLKSIKTSRVDSKYNWFGTGDSTGFFGNSWCKNIDTSSIPWSDSICWSDSINIPDPVQYLDSLPDSTDAGIACRNSSPTITNNYIARNGNVGIYLEGCSNSNITNNYVNNANLCGSVGIGLQFNSNNNLIENNTTNSNYHGICLYGSQNNVIRDNKADSNTIFGIYLDNNLNDTITGNTANNNTTGLYIYSWSNNTPNVISNNTFNDNSLDGIYLGAGDSTTIIDNNTSYNSGGIVLCSHGNQVMNNTANSNSDYGIDLQVGDNNLLTGNTANSNGGIGIRLITHSSNNQITNNTTNSNMWGTFLGQNSDSNILIGNTSNSNIWGIFIEQSSGNTVTGNTANNNTGTDDAWGIGGRTAYNNTIRNNTVSGNGTGIAFDYGSSYNTVDSNTTNSNGNGIVLYGCGPYNTVKSNTANYNNNWCGIYIFGSFNNILTNNTTNNNSYAGIQLDLSFGNNILKNNIANNNLYTGIWKSFSGWRGNDSVIGNEANYNNGYGFLFYQDSNSVIENNTVNYNFVGIVFSEGNHSIVRNNKTNFNTGAGLVIEGGYGKRLYNNIFTNNTADNNMVGLIFPIHNSANNIFRGNSMSNNKCNFGLADWYWGPFNLDISSYQQDIDTTNTVNGKPIYYCQNYNNFTIPQNAGFVGLINCDNITVENLTMTSNYHGLLLVNTSNSTIRNNVLDSSAEAGIALFSSSNNKITGNSLCNGTALSGASFGLLMMDSSCHNTITNNTINYNTGSVGSGILIASFEDFGALARPSDSNMIANNILSSNPRYGVWVRKGTGMNLVSLVNNKITGSSAGICFDAPTPALLYGRYNTITENDTGVLLMQGNADLGDLSIRGGNYIYDNADWDLCNFTPNTVLAQGNRWCCPTSPDIDGKILDDDENGLYGAVDFSNYFKWGLIPSDNVWQDVVFVGGETIIPEGNKLTINAGTVLRFAAGMEPPSGLTVLGELDLKGNKNNPVIFTSDALEPKPGDWCGIIFGSQEFVLSAKAIDRNANLISGNSTYQFYGSNDNKNSSLGEPLKSGDNKVKLNYVQIEYAKRGVSVFDKKLDFKNSKILNTLEYGIYGKNGEYDIKDNSIEGGIYIDSSKKVDFKKNIVTDGTYGLYLKDIKNIDVKEDTITGNDYGLYLTGFGDGDIKNNIIRENRIGINIGGAMKTKLKENQIVNNSDTGLVIRDSAKPELKKGNNAIYGSGSFDLVNNTVYTVYAEKNYWGTNNLDTIRAHIWDYYDNSTLGKVIFEPILTGWGYCGGPQLSNGISVIPLVFKLNDIEPNPFKELTTIKYQLPRKSSVSLQVYDKTGRVIKTLVNEEKETGYYIVSWDGKEYPAGIYFVRFVAGRSNSPLYQGDYKETKKLILIK